MLRIKKPANKETLCETDRNEERDSLNTSILPNWAGATDLLKDQSHIPLPQRPKKKPSYKFLKQAVHKKSQYRESLVEGSGTEAFYRKAAGYSHFCE